MASNDNNDGRRRWLSIAIAGGVGLLLMSGLVSIVMSMMGNADLPKKPKPVMITVMQPPPPPPPPPPPREEPPPPPEEKIEEPQPEPEPQPQPEPEPQAAEEPPVVSEGPTGSDGFGLKGGKNMAGKPGTIGGGGDRNRWYAGVIQRALQGLLAGNEEARASKYAVVLKIWVSRDGRLERFELLGSSGDPRVDSALKTALGTSPRLGEAPPENLPQPIRLRIVSR